MIALVLIVIAYLVGSIPFGLIVSRAKGIDIRSHGSGNIGATNVGRVLGRPYGLLVFGLDLLKGLVPTLLAGGPVHQAATTPALRCLLWMAVAAACIFGHMFPLYLNFKGGKGVATSLGALLGIYPYFTIPGLIAFGVWIVLTFSTRYVSVGSCGAAVALPIIFAMAVHLRRQTWGSPTDLWPLYAFAVVLAGLVIYRHRTNLQRLAAGTESKIGGGRHAEPAKPT